MGLGDAVHPLLPTEKTTWVGMDTLPGPRPGLVELAKQNAAAIAAGRSFIIFLSDGFYPLCVLNTLKMAPYLLRYCQPTEVVLAETGHGRGVLSVAHGFAPKGVEDEGDIELRTPGSDRRRKGRP